MKKLICKYCSKDFYIYLSRLKREGRGKFCSKKCYWKYRSPNESESPKLCACGCKKLTTVFRKKARKYISGHNKEPRFQKGHPHLNPKVLWEKGRIPWNKDLSKPITSTLERRRAMGKTDYILWRTAVFMRDNYTCQTCHIRGGKLEADHIKPWSLYPELRYAIDNGRTLCVSCHRQTDTWGSKVWKKS